MLDEILLGATPQLLDIAIEDAADPAGLAFAEQPAGLE